MKIKIIPKGLIKRECFKDLKKDFIIVDVKDNMTIEDLLKSLNIPKGYLSVITINRKRAGLKTHIMDNDTISFWPSVAGG